MKIKTLEEATSRIKELESEVKRLKKENELLRESVGGRRKHDAKWMSSYNDFVVKYEEGKSVMEIVSEGDISRRTAYRYLAYYKEVHNKDMNQEIN